jgi:ABC-type nitrate/sulfonate/bicarbonate transport system substrate-binding protein
VHRIRQILFVPPAPLVWALHRGLFAHHGVELETTQTASSEQMGQGLAAGTSDIGIAVVDNVIAWNADLRANLQILAQLERSTIMAFCAVQRHRSLADAAAEAIAVDATSNGFVLVLYRALAQAGIDWRTCRFDKVGGVRQRFEALSAGTTASTILVPPFIDMAVAQGFHVLWSGAAIAPRYPGVVLAAGADWVAANDAAALAYVRALLEANRWAALPANADAAVAALVAARYSEDAARQLVARTVPDLQLDPQGWDEVVALRAENGLLAQPAPDPARVIEKSLLDRASAAADHK